MALPKFANIPLPESAFVVCAAEVEVHLDTAGTGDNSDLVQNLRGPVDYYISGFSPASDSARVLIGIVEAKRGSLGLQLNLKRKYQDDSSSSASLPQTVVGSECAIAQNIGQLMVGVVNVLTSTPLSSYTVFGAATSGTLWSLTRCSAYKRDFTFDIKTIQQLFPSVVSYLAKDKRLTIPNPHHMPLRNQITETHLIKANIEEGELIQFIQVKCDSTTETDILDALKHVTVVVTNPDPLTTSSTNAGTHPHDTNALKHLLAKLIYTLS